MTSAESRFVNRELSWLEFNQRVLDEALDKSTPLIERVTFLAITAANLDEFFMVRVGGLELLIEGQDRRRDPSGMTPTQQLRAIQGRVARMIEDEYRLFVQEIEPQLAAAGIRRLTPKDADERQAEFLADVFEKEIFPAATPMVVEDDKPFPLLVNMGINVAVRVRCDRTPGGVRFAVIPMHGIDRFISVPTEAGFVYVLAEALVAEHVHRFFPAEEVLESAAFRLTRNADMSVNEEWATDLLSEMQAVLSRRKHAAAVRLETEGTPSRAMMTSLTSRVKIRPKSILHVPGPLDLSGFRRLAALEGFDTLRFDPWPPPPADVDLGNSIFEEIARGDILLSHPFESFEPVVRFVEEAARDPNVLAIKQVLYRTSARSPIVSALRQAARRGKAVTVIVELKARFDEARNIEWAQMLEEEGVQVIYGIRGLKTHAKICIVVRREPEGVMRYVHFGTGNYNEHTARLYTDIGYLTRNPDLGADASAFFNAISGYSEPREFLKLAAAPLTLRPRLLELIESETQRKLQGQDGLILGKMNSLVDPEIIEALYRASRAGVKIQFNVRGICCLRPGVKGLSENISVISIVDRFLEHSRIFCFRQGGQERVFISSADWMPRNLDRRIELLIPIEDPVCRRKVMNVLHTCLADTAKSRAILGDGRYEQPAKPHGRAAPVRSQLALRQEAMLAVQNAQLARRTAFEPHRPTVPTRRKKKR